MKITGRPSLPPTFPLKVAPQTQNPSPDSDPSYRKSSPKPPRRRSLNPAAIRRKKAAAPTGRRSRPETPLLKWKIEEGFGCVDVEDDDVAPEGARRGGRTGRKGGDVVVSARKLAAVLWRLQLPEVEGGGGGGGGLQSSERLGFQPAGVGHPFAYHHSGKEYGSEVNDLLQNPGSFSGTKNGFLAKNINSAMEGATKWDPVCLKAPDEDHQIHIHTKLLDQQASAAPMVSALESELEQARARIQELETERRSSKKKMEHFLKKVSEERAAWRSREHDKVRAFIEDMKAEVNRERKNRQRIEIVNSKLVNELGDAKLLAKRFMQDYEKERKARELIEEVCEELANEIGEDKAEVESFKRETMKLREEVDEERKMLQMAEVWREERVQMKLVDVKVAVEEKYSQMNKIVADLETFLRSKNATSDVKEMRETEHLRQAAVSLNIQEIKEFCYEPPNQNDIFSIFEDVNFGESNEREMEPRVAYSPASHASKIHTVSPEVNMFNKDNVQRHSNSFNDHSDEIEEDESGWETVSHLEDQGSSYSPDGSTMSVNRNHRDSNVSGSGTEWEDNTGKETPVTEINEVCAMPKRQMRKVSSIARLWRSVPNNGDKYKIISVEGMNGKLSNARLSNGSIMSPDRVSGKGELSPDFMGQWSSPESGNPHMNRGRKGCIEWPLGAQKNSLKAKLLEARMESQKVQLRHVLKQKI